jgi:hypothetical protein
MQIYCRRANHSTRPTLLNKRDRFHVLPLPAGVQIDGLFGIEAGTLDSAKLSKLPHDRRMSELTARVLDTHDRAQQATLGKCQPYVRSIAV